MTDIVVVCWEEQDKQRAGLEMLTHLPHTVDGMLCYVLTGLSTNGSI